MEIILTFKLAPCCDRLKYLKDIRDQAVNIGINNEAAFQFIDAAESMIIQMVPLIRDGDHDGVVTLYDAGIDNINTLRDQMFQDWLESIKSTYAAVPKTITEPME